ncbi:SDR family oxidoreductase [bacterium]|nr:SDR family oxidoreductase [bacterium]
MVDLKGKKALITGASSGFGADFADILAQKGMNLVITARRIEKLNALKEKIVEKYGVDVRVIAMDLTGFDAAERLYAEVKDENIDMLINNAGYGMYDYFERQDAAALNRMVQLNVVSAMTLANLFVKDFAAKNSGWILNTASFAAFNPTPFYAVYGATKAFLMNFSVALRTELKKNGKNVCVTAFCPGFTATEFVETAGQKRSWLVEKTIGRSYPAAVEAINGLLKNKPVVMPRLMNRFGAICLRFMPRSMAADAAFMSIRDKE